MTRHDRSGAHAGHELIVGSMFSGKSEELIRRVKRARIARRSVQVFRPALDDPSGNEIRSCHDVSRRTEVRA